MQYIMKRFLIFILVVLVAGSINFIIPRVAPGDPIASMMQRMSYKGATFDQGAEMINEYREMFGLDKPLYLQYFSYLKNIFQFNLGYSLAYFPAKAVNLISRSLPWTAYLLFTATLISFFGGTGLGVILAWSSKKMSMNIIKKLIGPMFLLLSALPFYVIAIILLYVFGFALGIFPVEGGYGINLTPGLNLKFILDVLYHSFLPAMSLVLASLGRWALGMRGMTISIMKEDFLILAEAKGLKRWRILWLYAARNAILPQVTSLAMALGRIAGGALLVEIIFAYPGIGWLLYSAIINSDYMLIQGITFFIIVGVAFSVFLIDIIYPKIDPRITYQRR